MRVARIVEKGKVELAEAPEPQPGPGQVLIQMLECGICGSDLHAYRGEWALDSKVGHEICGVVDAVGEGVEGLTEGTRVCAECFGHCGECRFCRSGDYNLCESISYAGWQDHGHMADKTLLPASALYPVPEELSDVEAMMVEPLAVAFRAVVRAGQVEGRTVAVLGAGTIGLLCAAVAKARGAAHVVVTAKHPQQAAMARKLGADTVVLLGKQKIEDVLEKAGLAEGLDAAIDSVGVGTSFSTALSLVGRQGHVVLVAGITRPLLCALGPVVNREIMVTGSACYAVTEGRPDFEWAIELIRSGAVAASALVTHTFPLHRIDQAFRTANDKGTDSIKVSVRIPG